MKSAIKVLKEEIDSFYLIRRLSLYEMKSANSDNYLGMLWEVINPMIQITIYWFVFGYGIRRNTPVALDAHHQVEFLPWMLSGIVVWFFVNPSILQGSKSIYQRIRFIAKMSFPMSAIPAYVIMAKFYQHLALVVIITIILQFTGFPISIYFIQLPYYMFAAFALLLSISLITSTLSTIIRDVQMVVQSIMRVLIYLSPFLWTPDRLPHFVQEVMALNPLYYLAEGYRSALLGTSWYALDQLSYTVYFWIVVVVLFMFGAKVHLKFRDHFIDYL